MLRTSPEAVTLSRLAYTKETERQKEQETLDIFPDQRPWKRIRRYPLAPALREEEEKQTEYERLEIAQ
jgi:hypothetical protein